MIWTIENGICDYSDENYFKKKPQNSLTLNKPNSVFQWNCQFYDTMCPFDGLCD